MMSFLSSTLARSSVTDGFGSRSACNVYTFAEPIDKQTYAVPASHRAMSPSSSVLYPMRLPLSQQIFKPFNFKQPVA